MKRTVFVAPYGYRLDGSRDAAEQAVIAIVRDGRARGVSYERIAEELNERGHRTRGGTRFYVSAVFAIGREMAGAEVPEGRTG